MSNRRSIVAVICPVRCPGWRDDDSDFPDRLRGELTLQTFCDMLQSGLEVYAVVGFQDTPDEYRKRLDWVASQYHGRLHLFFDGPSGLVQQLQFGIERAAQNGAEILALMSPENVQAASWVYTCVQPILEGWCQVVLPSRHHQPALQGIPITDLIRCERRNNTDLNWLLGELGLRPPEENFWDPWSGAALLRNDAATRRFFLANWSYAHLAPVDFMDSWLGGILLPAVLARSEGAKVRVADVSFNPSARTRDIFAAEEGAVIRCRHLGDLTLDMVNALLAGLRGKPSPLTWTLPILGAD